MTPLNLDAEALTPPLCMVFGIARAEAGEAFIHFNYGELQEYFSIRKYAPRVFIREDQFLAMKLGAGNPDDCIIVPMERCSESFPE